MFFFHFVAIQRWRPFQLIYYMNMKCYSLFIFFHFEIASSLGYTAEKIAELSNQASIIYSIYYIDTGIWKYSGWIFEQYRYNATQTPSISFKFRKMSLTHIIVFVFIFVLLVLSFQLIDVLIVSEWFYDISTWISNQSVPRTLLLGLF